jgi:hypothetical protein
MYLHRMTGDARPAAELPPRSGRAEARRATAETLDAVYQAVLGLLRLSQAHREQLRRRGLGDTEIDRRGYRTLPAQGRHRVCQALAERWPADTLLSVPGVVTRERDGRRYLTISGPAGLLVPIRDPDGRIAGLLVRPDDPGLGGKYRWLSSARDGGPGPGAPAHVPLGVTGLCHCIRLTEGAVKADVAYALSGLPTIGCSGLGWQAALPALRELGVRAVRLAYDMDAIDKPPVARALAAAAEGLAAEGLAVEMERWDAAAGKGIHDLLAAGKTPEVLTGDAALAAVREALAAATAGENPAEPEPLDRLDAVLAEGGEQALYRDAELLAALARLAEEDPAEYACRRAQLARHGIRLRDLGAALAPLRQALRRERPAPDHAGTYRVVGGRIVREVQTEDGPVEVPLANLSARIVAGTTVDDGAERTRRLAVEGELDDGTPLPRVEVPAEDYDRMEWVIPGWGARAVVYPGRATADHLRAAIQLLSGDMPDRTVYGHLGWREVGGRWCYLHAGGAIGADGPVADIDVSLPEALSGYVLPAPPDGEDLRRALRASLRLLELGPGRIAVPLLAAVYRAALGACDFALHLAGPTGAGKTELAALALQHCGAGLDARHLPGSWSSTGNALEGLAFAAKDALLVVDDFAPAGGAADVARIHREAERLLRAQGNAAGRLRMRADGALRPARPPRGLVLSTGEDIPRGQSLRARLLVLELAPGELDWSRLTAYQRDAAAGLFAQALAGYVRWLALRYVEVRGRLAAERAELRALASADGRHARTPVIVADLALGWRYMLDYAAAAGVLPPSGRAALWERGWRALTAAADAQAEHQQAAEPTAMYLRLLAAALASGRAHLAAPDGREPETPQGWGWRREDSHGGPAWRPQGRRIGWLDGEQLYLEPEAAYATAQALAGEQGTALAVTERTLRRRLSERGILLATGSRSGRAQLTVRRVVEGVRRELMCIGASSLYPAHGSTPSTPPSDIHRENGVETWGSNPPGQALSPPGLPHEHSDIPTNGVDGVVACAIEGTTRGSNPAYMAPGLSPEDVQTPWDDDAAPAEHTAPAAPAGGAMPCRRRGPDPAQGDLFPGQHAPE